MAIIYIYIFTLTDLVKEKSTINWSDIIIYIFWKLKLNSVTQITIVNVIIMTDCIILVNDVMEQLMTIEIIKIRNKIWWKMCDHPTKKQTNQKKIN